VNLLSPGPARCWFPTDFLPEGKQGIQSLDPPPPAFFLVKSPFPPSRERKNQFPGLGSFPAWEEQSLAVQEGDLGAPPPPLPRKPGEDRAGPWV